MRSAGVQRGQTGLSSSQKAHTPFSSSQCQRRRQQVPQAVPIPEIASIASTVQTFVDTIASAAPEPLQPAVQVIGGDIASVAALSPTMPGLLRLTVSGVTPCLDNLLLQQDHVQQIFQHKHPHFASVGLDHAHHRLSGRVCTISWGRPPIPCWVLWTSTLPPLWATCSRKTLMPRTLH